MSGQRYQYHDFFPRSTPRKTKGGIKAQSKRGKFGEGRWQVGPGPLQPVGKGGTVFAGEFAGAGNGSMG